MAAGNLEVQEKLEPLPCKLHMTEHTVTSIRHPKVHDVWSCCSLWSIAILNLHVYIREFKKATTATATGTSLNKRFNEQNNGCARAL